MITSALIVLFISSGCNKKESATNPTGPGTTTGGSASLTLNGAGFTNKSFSFAGVVGVYSASEKMTAIGGSSVSAGDTTQLAIVFPGSSTGTYQFSDTVGVVIATGSGSSARVFANALGGGQIAVTAYGSVAGYITGSFSGKLYTFSGNALDSVTVSNGSFNALRGPNQ
jgi:hypothetical protein